MEAEQVEIFRVDKKGLLQLQRNLADNMNKLKGLIDRIEAKNRTLIEALGVNDYKMVQSRVQTMQLNYECALKDMRTLLDYLEEYTDRVGEIQLILNEDGTIT